MTPWKIEREDDRLAVSGELRIADATPIWSTLRAAARQAGPHLDLDLTGAAVVDGAIMALLVELRAALVHRGTRCEIVGASAQLQPIVHLYRGDQEVRPPVRTVRPGAVERLGEVVEQRYLHVRALSRVFAQMTAALAAIVRRPRTANWSTIRQLVEEAGLAGVPIVVLINFLVGFVMALQSLPTLRMYGASIYVADIVGVSVTRELAPLMTAIIISGRSGAAFAAELGTMRVSEEIDALHTLGFRATPYLVVPRVIALAIVAPVLTLVADVVGVLGGVVVGITSLDLTPHGYLAEMRTVLLTSDVWTGLIKGFVFGIAVALIGCQQGLSTRGSAAAVGRATTATIVECLFTLVALDALFTLVFQRAGI